MIPEARATEESAELRRLLEQVSEARRQAEARAEQLATLNRVTQAITSERGLDSLLRTAAREMVELFGGRRSGIALREDGERVRVVAGHSRAPGEPTGVGEVRTLTHDPALARVCESGRPV